MKCQNCHNTVTRKTKYCPQCGEPVVARTSAREAPPKAKLPLGHALGLVGLGIILGYAILQFSSNSSSPTNQPVVNFQNTAAELNTVVLDIAKEFMCPCGTCSDPLDTCTCDHENGALKVKGFIAQQVRAGHKKPHIVEMVQTKYGGLKKEAKIQFKLEPPVK
ncbi:MAG: hypothetical protein ACE5HS_17730 [bacterium]